MEGDSSQKKIDSIEGNWEKQKTKKNKKTQQASVATKPIAAYTRFAALAALEDPLELDEILNGSPSDDEMEDVSMPLLGSHFNSSSKASSSSNSAAGSKTQSPGNATKPLETKEKHVFRVLGNLDGDSDILEEELLAVNAYVRQEIGGL